MYRWFYPGIHRLKFEIYPLHCEGLKFYLWGGEEIIDATNGVVINKNQFLNEVGSYSQDENRQERFFKIQEKCNARDFYNKYSLIFNS